MASTQTSTRTQLVEVGARLKALRLPRIDGKETDLRRAARGTGVLVLAHRGRCDGCAEFLTALADARDDIWAWGALPIAVVDDTAAADLPGELPYPVLVDHDGTARDNAGVGGGGAAVVIADRFGTVYRADAVGDDHAFPAVDEIEAEVRYIGSQCPECGVPDDPLRGEESWGEGAGH